MGWLSVLTTVRRPSPTQPRGVWGKGEVRDSKGKWGFAGSDGNDSAFQTITVSNGSVEETYDSTQVSCIRFTGTAVGNLSNGVLTISGLKGNPGNDGSTPANGLDSAMQKITVGGQTDTSDSLNEVVFPGATANLENCVLTLALLTPLFTRVKML